MTEPALTAERILDTAEEVLRRYGPAKATVIDVARALGVSHGSVYRHFSSKAALRDAVLERWLGRVSTPLAAIVEEEGPAALRLRRWLDALIVAKRQKVQGDPELFATYVALAAESRDVIAGHVDTAFSSVPSVLSIVRGGQVRALAVSSIKRAAAAPDVPTIAESGYPGYNAVGWGAIFVPNGTPQPIIDKLNATIAAVVTRPEVKKQFEEQGTEAASSTQAEMAKLLREEYARLGETAKRIGVAVN